MPPEQTKLPPAPASHHGPGGRKLLSLAHHRNGVCGAPFYVALWDEGGRKFMVTYFHGVPDYICCAVVDVDMAAAGEVRFGVNSWRGDQWEQSMQWAIAHANAEGSKKF